MQKRTPNILFPLLASLIVVCLSACGEGDKTAKLKAHVAKVKVRKGYHVEPIPQLKKAYAYQFPKDDRRSPFVPVKEKFVRDANAPDLRREKEPLEAFTIDSLRMVGTMRDGDKLWAIITAPDGFVYRISEGRYIGRNYGVVQRITDQELLIAETVSTDDGWEKRTAKIAMTEEKE